MMLIGDQALHDGNAVLSLRIVDLNGVALQIDTHEPASRCHHDVTPR